jgi:hypothetical protein
VGVELTLLFKDLVFIGVAAHASRTIGMVNAPRGNPKEGAKIMKSKKAKVSKLHKGKKLEEQKPLKEYANPAPMFTMLIPNRMPPGALAKAWNFSIRS